MSSTTTFLRGKNVVPQETQALLRSCLDLKVEEVRRSSGRISHLFYDVQQRMNEYGPFPERKLYLLQRNYFRAEQDFKSGKLRPYPPEARELWGKPDYDDDAAGNDQAWKELLVKTTQRKSLHQLNNQEISAIISECWKRNIEKLPAEQLDDTFALIVRKLQNKKIYLGRTAEDLQRAYARLKKRYLQKRSIADFPELAAKLWGQPAVSSAQCSENSDFNTEESVVVKVESNNFTAVKIRNVCRVCRTEDLLETKHLFEDAYQNQTYAEIIHETIHVKIMRLDNESSILCRSCASYVESLTKFVRQCQDHCEGAKVTNDPTDRSNQVDLPSVHVKSEVLDSNEIWIATKFEDCKNDTIKSRDNSPELGFDDSVDADGPNSPASSSDERVVDNAEPESTVSIEERNQQRFQESRGVKTLKQCEICGKTFKDIYCHMITHTDAKSVACDFCQKVFSDKRRMMIHRNRHTKEKSYPCSYCDKVFYVSRSRQDHEKTHITKANNISYSCDQCDAVYKVEKCLQLHIRHKHMGIRPLKCKKCDFSTFAKIRLLNHVRRIHSEERPYCCPLCGFTCNSNSGYFVHYQRHKKNGEATGYTIRCAYCNEAHTKDTAFEKHIVAAHPDRAIIV